MLGPHDTWFLSAFFISISDCYHRTQGTSHVGLLPVHPHPIPNPGIHALLPLSKTLFPYPSPLLHHPSSLISQHSRALGHPFKILAPKLERNSKFLSLLPQYIYQDCTEPQQNPAATLNSEINHQRVL